MKITDEIAQEIIARLRISSDSDISSVKAIAQAAADLATKEAADRCNLEAEKHLTGNEYFNDAGPELEAAAEAILALIPKESSDER